MKLITERTDETKLLYINAPKGMKFESMANRLEINDLGHIAYELRILFEEFYWVNSFNTGTDLKRLQR